MPFSSPPPDKTPNGAKQSRAPLALRLNQAASDLNPFLIVLAVGLLVLNITLYLGMAAARTPFVWTAPPQADARAATTPTPEPAALDPTMFGR